MSDGVWADGRRRAISARAFVRSFSRAALHCSSIQSNGAARRSESLTTLRIHFCDFSKLFDGRDRTLHLLPTDRHHNMTGRGLGQHHSKLVLRRRQIIRFRIAETDHFRPDDIARTKTPVQLDAIDFELAHIPLSDRARKLLFYDQTSTATAAAAAADEQYITRCEAFIYF